MAHAMKYNGTTLVWVDKKSYKATSGMIGSQRADKQNLSDHGPIPEGTYRLLAKDVGVVKSVNGEFVPRPGIETLPPNPQVIQTWGNNRVLLKIEHIDRANCRHRNGFYIHDSHKGFTHGCIEVEAQFFVDLRAFADKKDGHNATLTLKVEYPSSSSSTDGKTAF